MNTEELFRSRFGPESAQELAQVLGMEPEQTARLLDRAVRSQLEALAQQAKSDAGRTGVLDAIANLPRFRDVQHALTEQGGSDSLRLAGELLSPTLLGHDQTDLAGQLSRVEGVPQPTITSLMNMSLPLLLSFIGQAGVNESSITSVMSTIRASGVRPRSTGGSYVSRAAAANAPRFVDGKETQQAAGETKKSEQGGHTPPAPQPSTPPSVTGASAPVAPAPAQPTPSAVQTQPAQTQPAQAQPAQTQPAQGEPGQGDDYSKASVVSALLEGAEVPEPGDIQRSEPPAIPAAPIKENPYRPQESEAEQEPNSQPEPELAQDTDYSKASVLSALRDSPSAKAPASTVSSSTAPAGAAPAERPASEPAQAAQPVAASQAPAEPSAKSSAPAAAPSQAAASSGSSAEALAAAAAAAGVGAGAVRPAGSPWKSAQPVVIGGQPSQAPATARGPQAVPADAAPASAAPASGPLTADSLVSYFHEQFAGAGVGALAEAAGFSQRDAGRAVQGTAAVLLRALSQKGQDEAGAAELLELGADYGRVAADGRLNTVLLGNRAELGALEVRGLSVLDRVLDNPSQVGGRLGTALGTSGEQAGRLLALLTPFVLGLLSSRARASSADAPALSGALGGLDAARVERLLPEGMGALKSLLGMQLFGAAPKERATLLQTKQAKAAPAATPSAAPEAPLTDRPAPPVQPMTPEPPRPAAPAQPERRGGFPWWLLLLPLLLGLAWYFGQQRREQPATVPTQQTQTQPAAPADDSAPGAFSVTAPAEGASVPASGFTLSGTAEPNTTYRLLQDGTQVGTLTSDASGNWSSDIAATDPGQHVYSVQTESGTEVIRLPLTLK